MVTGHGSEQAAIEATRLGASDHMSKPVETDELPAGVRRIVSNTTARVRRRQKELNREGAKMRR